MFLTAGKGVLRKVWQLVILVVGSVVLLLGIAMLVLPGPGIITILVALATLATEFFWARELLKGMRKRLARHLKRWRQKRRAKDF